MVKFYLEINGREFLIFQLFRQGSIFQGTMLEFEMGRSQLQKYFYMPLLKVVSAIVLGVMVSLIWFDLPKNNLLEIVFFTLIFVGFIHFFPFLLIALKHIKNSKGKRFVIDSLHGEYHNSSGKKISFELDQIDKVIKVVSPPKFDGRLDFLGFGNFFYWEVILKNRMSFILSCMIVDRDDFFGRDVELRKKTFVLPPTDFLNHIG